MNLDNKKSYLPFIHYPGEAQADFGAAQFFENSLSHEGEGIWYFRFRSVMSGISSCCTVKMPSASWGHDRQFCAPRRCSRGDLV